MQSEGGIADHKSNLQAHLSFSPGNRISLRMPSIIILRSAQWGPANARICRVNYLHDCYSLQRRRSSRIIKLGYQFTCWVNLRTLLALRGNGRLWWSSIHEHVFFLNAAQDTRRVRGTRKCIQVLVGKHEENKTVWDRLVFRIILKRILKK